MLRRWENMAEHGQAGRGTPGQHESKAARGRGCCRKRRARLRACACTRPSQTQARQRAGRPTREKRPEPLAVQETVARGACCQGRPGAAHRHPHPPRRGLAAGVNLMTVLPRQMEGRREQRAEGRDGRQQGRETRGGSRGQQKSQGRADERNGRGCEHAKQRRRLGDLVRCQPDSSRSGAAMGTWESTKGGLWRRTTVAVGGVRPGGETGGRERRSRCT